MRPIWRMVTIGSSGGRLGIENLMWIMRACLHRNRNRGCCLLAIRLGNSMYRLHWPGMLNSTIRDVRICGHSVLRLILSEELRIRGCSGPTLVRKRAIHNDRSARIQPRMCLCLSGTRRVGRKPFLLRVIVREPGKTIRLF